MCVEKYLPGLPYAHNQYILGEQLGAGSHARVHKAVRLGPSKEYVALKIAKTPDFGKLAVHEREIHETLRHPNVLTFHQGGIDEANLPYMELALAQGSLATVLEEGGPPEVAIAVPMLVNVAQGLDYIHGQRIIHRDLKPDNLLVVSQENQVVIADFGISMQTPTDSFFTYDNDNYGSAAYAAPERVGPKPYTVKASDVYSLAAISYEVLTGQKPFIGETAIDFATAHLTDTPLPFEKVVGDGMMTATLAELEGVVSEGMKKDPTERPSAGDFGEMLIVAFGKGQAEEAKARTMSTPGRSGRRLTRVPHPRIPRFLVR